MTEKGSRTKYEESTGTEGLPRSPLRNADSPEEAPFQFLVCISQLPKSVFRSMTSPVQSIVNDLLFDLMVCNCIIT